MVHVTMSPINARAVDQVWTGQAIFPVRGIPNL